MATKYLGLGTVLSVDYDGDDDYDTIPVVINGKPPAREFEEVDETTLDDTLQVNTLGIEKHSHYTFRVKWDHGDTVQHALVNTTFASKAAKNWRIVFTSGTNNTWTFPGKIVKLEPQSVEHNKHIELEITVHRTGAITVS